MGLRGDHFVLSGEKADGSLILMEERDDSGLRDRGRSVLIIVQSLDWERRGAAGGPAAGSFSDERSGRMVRPVVGSWKF